MWSLTVERVARFADDTAVVALGDGRFAVDVRRDWFVHVGPNGGFVAAVLLRAAVEALADPARRPRTLNVNYLAALAEGEAVVEVRVERVARSAAFVSCRLVQGDRTAALALVSFATERAPVVGIGALRPPGVLPPERCVDLLADLEPAPVRARWDTRWAIGPAPARQPVGAPPSFAAEAIEVGGWIRPSGPSGYDAVVLAAMADGWIPPLIARYGAAAVSTPTIELTVHFRDHGRLAALADDEWCLVRFVSSMSGEGFVNEDGEIWSGDGHLLAHSRQLAMLTPPPAGWAGADPTSTTVTIAGAP